MDKRTQEWLIQADYDMDTADYMFQGGRYFYAVFMCHLSIEKALKGMYIEKLKKVPPKTHNLMYLIDLVELQLQEEHGKLIIKLNEAHIITRYPQELNKISQTYPKLVAQKFLKGGREILQWIKQKL